MKKIEESELVKTNTEHILQVIATVHEEQDLQEGPYGDLICDLLGLVQVLRGYSPDLGLIEENQDYLGNGRQALIDCSTTGVSLLIASLALLPTGKAAGWSNYTGFLPWPSITETSNGPR